MAGLTSDPLQPGGRAKMGLEHVSLSTQMGSLSI